MDGDIDHLIGARLRARRKLLGLSQKVLGNAIGVRFQQIQKYECGANGLSARRLWALAVRLGVSTEYFFDGVRQTAVSLAPRRHGGGESVMRGDK